MVVVPLKPHFENMRALLACIAEDAEAVGFVGCVILANGTMEPVHFGATREQLSFAAAIWLSLSVTAGDAEEDV